ncbi:MAG: MFS transporter [Haloferacaceae archaeon]
MTPPRRRTRMLSVASGSLLLAVLVWFNYSAVLPRVVADWGLSGLRAGVVFGAFQAGYLLAVVPAGMVADRRSPRHVIAAGAATAGVASLAFAGLADGFLVGTALRFVAGVGMAGVYVPGMRFVTAWYPPEERGRAMGIYVGTYSLSAGLSFLVASAVATRLGWRTAVAATSAGALFVPLLVLGVGRDAPGAGDDDTGFDLGVLRNRAYLAAVGVYSFHNWELFGMRNWIVAYLVAATAVGELAAPEATAGTVAGAVILLGGLGNVLGGSLSDRFGRRRVVGAALLTSGALSATLGLAGGLPLPALLVLVGVYGVALTMDSAPTSTAVTEIVDDDRVGTALSVQSLVGFTTTVASPIAFGAALDAAGYGLAFPTLAAGAAVALVSLAALSRLAPAPEAATGDDPADA